MKDIRIELMDKENDYQKYREIFYKCFPPIYQISGSKSNPFRVKDNLYFLGYLEGELVGICNVAFLHEGIYNKLHSGEVEDDMVLTSDDMVNLSEDVNRIYIPTTAVLEDYRRMGVAYKLRRAVELHFEENYANTKNMWLSLCINDEAYNLNKKLGLSLVRVNYDGTKVMSKEDRFKV